MIEDKRETRLERFIRSQIEASGESERLSRHVERALIDACLLALLVPNRLEAARWLSVFAARLDEIDRKLEGDARTTARAFLATQIEKFEDEGVLAALYARGITQ